MPKIIHKKESQKDKSQQLKFYIDCAQPVEDKVLLLSDFENFLKTKIKVQGKQGNLGSDIVLKKDGNKIVVDSKIPFSKRYLKYLTKKYLKKQDLRNYLYVVASDKHTYQLKYFNIQSENAEEQ